MGHSFDNGRIRSPLAKRPGGDMSQELHVWRG